MLQPLLLAIIGTYFVFAAMVILQLRLQIVLGEGRSNWLAEYATNKLR